MPFDSARRRVSTTPRQIAEKADSTIEEMIMGIFPREEDIPASWRPAVPEEQNRYLIGGALRRWKGPIQEVISPVRTESSSGLLPRVLGEYPLLSGAEAMTAIEAARGAYLNGRGIWPAMTFEERIGHVRQFAGRLAGKRREIINLLMWETGKPLAEASGEFDRTMECVTESSAAALDLLAHGRQAFSEDDLSVQIHLSPLGVLLCLGPYNFPLNEILSIIIPALIMGNTVVFKPPRFGSILYGHLLSPLKDSFPPGTVNVIFGESDDIADEIMKSGKVDALAVIGSSQTAERLARLHPHPDRVRILTGLEAKNPAIVLAHADLEPAVRECVTGALRFNGQRCTALKILFVHVSLVEKFVTALAEAVKNLPFGMPWEEGVFLTPLPDPQRLSTLSELLDDARQMGARVVNESGGVRRDSFFYPAILYPVREGMRIYSEEQFGPIIPVVPFEDIEEPLAWVAESDYSQQASVFGTDRAEVERVVRALTNQVCRININRHCQRGPDTLPFAARRSSGSGVRSVSDTLKTFSIPTVITGFEQDPI